MFRVIVYTWAETPFFFFFFFPLPLLLEWRGKRLFLLHLKTLFVEIVVSRKGDLVYFLLKKNTAVQ